MSSTTRGTEQKAIAPDVVHEMKAPSGALRRSLEMLATSFPRLFDEEDDMARFFEAGLACPFWESATRYDRRERIRSWSGPLEPLLERRLTYLPDELLERVRPRVDRREMQAVVRLVEIFEIGTLLRTARISARQMQRLLRSSETTPPYARAADLALSIDEALTILDADLEPIEVVLDLPDLPPIEAVVPEIQQVWVNLILNAVEALERSPDGQITIRARHDGDAVEIVIRDNGPGIPEAQLEQIFEPAASMKASSGNPRGFGLTITREIVERHGGSVRLVNHPDGGAQATVRLPAN